MPPERRSAELRLRTPASPGRPPGASPRRSRPVWEAGTSGLGPNAERRPFDPIAASTVDRTMSRDRAKSKRAFHPKERGIRVTWVTLDRLESLSVMGPGEPGGAGPFITDAAAAAPGSPEVRPPFPRRDRCAPPARPVPHAHRARRPRPPSPAAAGATPSAIAPDRRTVDPPPGSTAPPLRHPRRAPLTSPDPRSPFRHVARLVGERRCPMPRTSRTPGRQVIRWPGHRAPVHGSR